MQDGSIDLTLFNGGIRNAENEHIAQLLRAKSKILVAFGSCASEGCIPGLANLSASAATSSTPRTRSRAPTTRDHLARRPCGDVPEGELAPARDVPPVCRTLDQVVEVDYYMPGCPPESAQIAAVIDLVIAGAPGTAQLPPTGSILGAGNSTVCDECPRTRNVKPITSFKRIQDVAAIDPDLCLLEQGIPCNGPATRSGCAARCPLGRRAVHRLLRPGRRRRRLRRAADLGLRLGDRSDTIRRRSSASWMASPIRPASSTASIWPGRCCASRPLSGRSRRLRRRRRRNMTRITIDPDHPPGRPRQDRDLPRRGGRRRQHLLPDPGAARLRALLRRPAGRGDAAPHQPHLRRLPGGASHGRRQGRRRRLPRRPAARRPRCCASCSTAPSTSPTTRPTSTPWAAPTSSSAPTLPSAERNILGVHPQGGAGDRRPGHPGAQDRPRDRRDDRRAQGPPLHVDPRRHDQGHHRGGARRDRADGPLRWSSSPSSA